jgi:hypothetical protein
MTEDDMAYWWGLYIDKLRGLLAVADARPHGPAPDTARRIQALQREALFLHIRYPQELHDMLAAHGTF